MASPRSRLRGQVGALVVASSLVFAACSEAPVVPLGADGQPDPVLLEGRRTFQLRCQSCHGTDGGGGRGPSIRSERIVGEYPDPADQAAFVAAGKGQMPAFSGELTADEIDAVVRYTREVLQ